jgi:amino acid transporter
MSPDHPAAVGDEKRVQQGGTADDQLANEFGYNPVFDRKYGTWSSLSFAFSVGGLFTALVTTFAYPLQAGGPAAIVWCWFIAGASSLALSASVSELISAYPTAAGVYYTISRLAPPRMVPILSW